MGNLRTSLIAFIALIVAAGLIAQSRRKSRLETAGTGQFDYYVLSLSWAPAFCAQPGASRYPEECAPGRHTGFIVHGLWPEDIAGRGPESCGPAKRVPKRVVDLVLPDMLAAGLIQHEWATHGVCTGLNPFDYFSSVLQTRAAVQIPVQISALDGRVTETPGQIEAQFRDANPSFPATAFRTYCPKRTFEEERICFDRNLNPRACTVSTGECAVPSVTVLPPS